MNTYVGSQREFVVIWNGDGTYSTFPVGKIPVGPPLRKPRNLMVSGEGEVPCPPMTATPSRLIEWLKNVNSDGSFATLRNP